MAHDKQLTPSQKNKCNEIQSTDLKKTFFEEEQ